MRNNYNGYRLLSAMEAVFISGLTARNKNGEVVWHLQYVVLSGFPLAFA